MERVSMAVQMARSPRDANSDGEASSRGFDLSSESEETSHASGSESTCSDGEGPILPYCYKLVDSSSPSDAEESKAELTSDSDQGSKRLVNLSW